MESVYLSFLGGCEGASGLCSQSEETSPWSLTLGNVSKPCSGPRRIPVFINISPGHLLLPSKRYRERRKGVRKRERKVMFTRSVGVG